MANRYYDKPAKFRVSDSYGEVTLQIDISTLSDSTFLTEEYEGYKVFNDVTVYTDDTKTELKYPIGWYEVVKYVNPDYDPTDPDSPEYLFKWAPSQTDGQTIEFSNIDDEGVRAKYLNETYKGYRVLQLVTMRDSSGEISRYKGWYECHDIQDYEVDPDLPPIWEWVPSESESGAIEQVDSIAKTTLEPNLKNLGKVTYLYSPDTTEDVFTINYTPGLYVVAPRDAEHELPYWKKVDYDTPEMDLFVEKLQEHIIADGEYIWLEKDSYNINPTIDGHYPPTAEDKAKYPEMGSCGPSGGIGRNFQQPLNFKRDLVITTVNDNYSTMRSVAKQAFAGERGRFRTPYTYYAAFFHLKSGSQAYGDIDAVAKWPAFSGMFQIAQDVYWDGSHTRYECSVAAPWNNYTPGLWYPGGNNEIPHTEFMPYYKDIDAGKYWYYMVQDLNVFGRRLPDAKIGQYIVLMANCTVKYGYSEEPGFYSVQQFDSEDPTEPPSYSLAPKCLFDTTRDITDICSIPEGVEGYVQRHGNMIMFSLKGDSDSYITTVASGLPNPINGVEPIFTASTSNEESTASAPCKLTLGSLSFLDTEGFKKFTVSGTYYTGQYDDHLGVMTEYTPVVPKIGYMPEASQELQDEVYMYTGNTYTDPVIGRVVKGSLWSVIYDTDAAKYKWVCHSSNYEQTEDPVIVKSDGVEGECHRDGSTVSFWFSYSGTEPINVIATMLPYPMLTSQPKFVAITSYDGASTSAVVELSDAGELMFSGNEEYTKFTISGVYKTRAYVGASLVTAPWHYKTPLYVTQEEWAALPDEQKVDGHYIITRKVGEGLGFSRPTWHKDAWLVARFYNATKDVWKNTTGMDVYVTFNLYDLRNSYANNIIVQRKVYDSTGVMVGCTTTAGDVTWYNKAPVVLWVPAGGKISVSAQSNVWWDDPTAGDIYYTTDNLDIPINLINDLN